MGRLVQCPPGGACVLPGGDNLVYMAPSMPTRGWQERLVVPEKSIGLFPPDPIVPSVPPSK